jgi:hypothetical protein
MDTSPPRISVCSAHDLTSLDPRDIFTKLRMLAGVVIGLFCVMHLGAALGALQDRSERQRTLARLHSRALGFTPCDSGDEAAWVWELRQEAVKRDLDTLAGPAANAARLVGMPYIRLRAALPEELLPGGSVATATGRACGLSAAAVEANSRDYLRSLALPSAGVCCGAAADEYDDDNTASPPALRADQAADTDAALQFGSTAFMYALLSMRCLLAEAEITAQRERSIAYFARLGLDGADGSRFMRTVEQLKAMLASDNLRKRANWLNRARLWRLILLSNDAGCYDSTQGLAFALLAVTQQPAAVSAATSVLARAWNAVGALVSLQQGAAADDALAPSSAHHHDASAKDAPPTLMDVSPEDAATADCPLSFSAAAILGSMPRSQELLARGVALRADAEPSLDEEAHAARVWTTALCCATMTRLEVCWALNSRG